MHLYHYSEFQIVPRMYVIWFECQYEYEIIQILILSQFPIENEVHHLVFEHPFLKETMSL